MSLVHALMRYKNEKRIQKFRMHGNEKATVTLANNKDIRVFMSDDYVVGQVAVLAAAESPTAQFLIYNHWGKVTSSAEQEAKRIGIEIHVFKAFAFRLDELNGRD